MSKQMNNLKEDTIHMIGLMLEIIDISGIVEENKRESIVIVIKSRI